MLKFIPLFAIWATAITGSILASENPTPSTIEPEPKRATIVSSFYDPIPEPIAYEEDFWEYPWDDWDDYWVDECDPNYSGCVPIASDVDCLGGKGDWPEYISWPVRVIGRDIYKLDRDKDGIACE